MKEKIKELEAKVRELEQKNYLFGQILNHLPTGVQAFDKDGFLCFINKQQIEILGPDNPEVSIGSFNILTAPFSTENKKTDIYKEIYTGENLQGEYQRDFEPRTTKWIPNKENRVLQEKIVPLKDNNSNTQFVITILEEVTPKKSDQDKKKEWNFDFKDFVDHAPDILYKFSSKRGGLFCSKSIERILGYTPEEILKNPFLWYNAIHPADKANVDKSIKEDFFSIEYRAQRKDGSWLWLRDYFMHKSKIGDEIIIEGHASDITSQKQAELNLKNSERKWRQAIDATEQAIWDWNIANNLFIPSESWKRILGFENREVGNRLEEWSKRVHTDDMKLLWETLNKHLDGNLDTFEASYRIRKKDGSYITVLDKGRIIERDTKGTPTRMIGGFSDITELKKLEEQLRQSEQRWFFSVDGSGLGLWDWEVTTNKVFFSAQWKKMLGFEPDEIRASLDEWDKRVHPDDKERTYADIQKHMDGKTPIYQNEHRVLCKDGSYKWILDRGKVVERTQDGKPKRMIGTHTDITARKVRDITEKEISAKYKLLFEQSPIGIYIADTQGNITEGNQRMLELLGSPSLEQSKKINVLEFQPLVKNGYAELFKKCITTKQKQLIELEYVSKWGKNNFLSSYMVPLTNERGEVEHVYTLMEDISKRKSAEQELKRSQARLELFFQQSLIGFFFMMLDEPITWDETVEKEKVLDYVFEHQRITKANEAMLQQYKATQEAFIGCTPAQLFSHDLKKGRETWRMLFDQGKLHIDLQERDFEGNPIIVNGDYICMYDDQKRIIGHYGVQRDVTTERTAQQQLRNSETNFRTFFNTIDSYLFILNETANIIKINQAVKERLKYSGEELMGKSILLVHPEKRRNEAAQIVQEMLQGKRRYCPIPLQAKTGEEIPVETFITKGYWNGEPAIFGASKDISELRLSEQKFATAFQMSPAIAGISEIKSGIFIEVNKVFCEILEFTEEEVIGKSAVALNILSEKQRSALYEQLSEEGKIRNKEVVLRTKSGKKIETLTASDIIHIAGKQYNFTMAIDVSNIKKKENELLIAKQKAEKSNKQLKEAQSIALLGSWSINFETNETEWSEEIYRIFEIADFDQKPTNDFFFKSVHPDDIQFLNKEMEIAEQTNQTFDITHRIITKHQTKHVRERGKIILNEQGMRIFVSGTVQDVTKEKKLQTELAQSEVLKKNILASIPTLIWAKNIHGKYIACNPEFERFFGANEKDILGKTDYDFVDKELADFFRLHDKKAIAAGKPTKNEEWITYADNGEHVLLETTKTPLRDQHGETFGVLGVAYNITERTKREESLKTAKQEAEKANRLKSEFLANMSHEIRTPMNAVLGYSEILSKKLKSHPEFLNYVEGINKGGKNLISLINDILDISKIEAGQLDLDPEPICLQKLIEDIQQIFAVKTEMKNLQFELKISPALPKLLLLDQKRIRQILFNLVGNALKFTEKGKVVLAAHTTANELNKNKTDLYISVSDTGVGIPKKQLNDIFAAFHRSKRQTGKIEGTGLGLSITKRLVEAMNGKITVSSKVGEGSTFTVRIKNIQQPKTLPSTTETENIDVQTVHFKNAKILVTDDIESNIFVLKESLKDLGCKVITARNGAEALTVIETERPDLTLMDIQMPIMNGYEATKKIRATPHLAQSKIVALTALALKEQEEGFRHAFDDYLKKPIELSAIINCFKKHLPYSQLDQQEGEEQQEQTGLFGIEEEIPEEIKTLLREQQYHAADLINFFDSEDSLLLAQKIDQAASKFDIAVLKEWANELKIETKTMNISRIRQLLSNFEHFLDLSV